MSAESLEEQVKKFGSMEQYKAHLTSGFANEQAVADLLKWYGSKEKAIEAVMQATDSQFGEGCAAYVAHAIQQYYGM